MGLLSSGPEDGGSLPRLAKKVSVLCVLDTQIWLASGVNWVGARRSQSWRRLWGTRANNDRRFADPSYLCFRSPPVYCTPSDPHWLHPAYWRLPEGEGLGMTADMAKRKPGRPRAIPESMVPEVLRLYGGGLGYRAIARELAKRGVWADWSTVGRVIKSRRTGESTGGVSSTA